jgi:hypothetical protein
MLEKHIEEHASPWGQTLMDQLKEIHGAKMMRDSLLRECVDDDGVKGFLAAPEKRRTVVYVASNWRGKRKILSSKRDRLRIDIDYCNGSAHVSEHGAECSAPASDHQHFMSTRLNQ